MLVIYQACMHVRVCGCCDSCQLISDLELHTIYIVITSARIDQEWYYRLVVTAVFKIG